MTIKLSTDNMYIQLLNTTTNVTREIALPPGLTPAECVEYGRRFAGPNEEVNGTYEASF